MVCSSGESFTCCASLEREENCQTRITWLVQAIIVAWHVVRQKHADAPLIVLM